MNILFALIIIIVIFEIIGQVLPYMDNQSFLFDTQSRFDTIFNEARLQIIILQVAIIGIIALGVTQVIITAGIDLSVPAPLVARDSDDRDEFRTDRAGQRQPEPEGNLWHLGHGSAGACAHHRGAHVRGLIGRP